MSEPLNLDEYEAAARERLHRVAFDYIAGGAEDEATLRRNRDAFERWREEQGLVEGREAVEVRSSD